MRDIAVGVDGSNGSIDALRWATGLAEATSAAVRTISSWQMPLIASLPAVLGPMPSQAFIASHSADRIHRALDDAGLSGAAPSTICEGEPGAVLAAATEEADLVVVGRTGIGRRHGLVRVAEVILGSTARHCLHNAAGPVAAVPAGSQWVASPTVVVGVDGSAASHKALAWAVENLPDSARIIAVRAVPPRVEALLALDQEVFDLVVRNAHEELAESLEAVLGSSEHDLASRVEPRVVVEPARYALIDPGFEVNLVVVGARSRSPVMARVLGSIADHAVRHATCPVVVVPAD